MSGSPALRDFVLGIDEVEEILQAVPSEDALQNEVRTKALCRAAVVLLCSHYERYIYALNELLCDELHSADRTRVSISEGLKLVHSSVPIGELAGMSWERRAQGLSRFIITDAWLWSANEMEGELMAERLLRWMKSPNPKALQRYFRMWGIGDIFDKITRKPTHRSEFWNAVQGVVDKRNAIAHGNGSESASLADVERYKSTLMDFCERIDRNVSLHISRQWKIQRPWW